MLGVSRKDYEGIVDKVLGEVATDMGRADTYHNVDAAAYLEGQIPAE